jgi:hypothetical protein
MGKTSPNISPNATNETLAAAVLQLQNVYALRQKSAR